MTEYSSFLTFYAITGIIIILVVVMMVMALMLYKKGKIAIISFKRGLVKDQTEIKQRLASTMQTVDLLVRKDRKQENIHEVENRIKQTLGAHVEACSDERLARYLTMKANAMLEIFRNVYIQIQDNEASFKEMVMTMNVARIQLKEDINKLKLEEFNDESTPIRKKQLEVYLERLSYIVNDRQSTANHILERYLAVSEDYMNEQIVDTFVAYNRFTVDVKEGKEILLRDLISEWRRMLAKGEILHVIRDLRNYLSDDADKYKTDLDNLLILEGKYNAILNDIEIGTLTQDAKLIEETKLRKALANRISLYEQERKQIILNN